MGWKRPKFGHFQTMAEQLIEINTIIFLFPFKETQMALKRNKKWVTKYKSQKFKWYN
jgi:hypothetical protein